MLLLINPYTTANPLSSTPAFSTNINNGDISIRPTTVGQRTVTALRVEEYRNGQLIGSVMRDLQLIVINCNNNLPTLSGVNGTTNYTVNVCANSTICFDIYGKDIDSATQNITMAWNGAIAGASFIVGGAANSPDGRFCWSPTSANVGTKIFTVTVEDNACPIIGTQTYSYTVNVLTAPLVLLRSDTTISCGTTIPLTPTVFGGNPGFTYLWNSGETSQTVNKSTGFYRLTVTDTRGCIGKDSVNINGGIVPNFSNTPGCAGKPTSFTDLSTSLGTKNSWQWNFGDGGTSTLQNPQHTYNAAGTYNVTLTVGDNLSCSASLTFPVIICNPPTAAFNYNGQCEEHPISFTNTSTGICTLTSWVYDFGDGTTQSYGTDPGIVTKSYNNPGTFNATLIVTNANGCSDTATQFIVIIPRPTADIIESSFFFACNDPDTVLHATAVGGTPPYTYSWNTGSTGLTTAANSIGSYSFTVTDDNACSHTESINISDPLSPAFTSSPYCNTGDIINFTSNGSSNWPVTNYNWNFGDGTPVSTMPNPSHLYTQEKIYSVKLKITDNTGCIDSVSNNVIIMVPDNVFTVSEDTVCFGQSITVTGPKGPFINSWVLNYDNGNTPSTQNIPYGDTTFSYVQPQWPYTYPTAGSYNFLMNVVYNNGQCIKNYDTIFVVHPQLTVDFNWNQQCAGVQTNFTGSQVGGTSPVDTWDWDFGSTTSAIQNPSLTYPVTGLGPVSYMVTLDVKDFNNCTGSATKAVRMTEVAMPCISKTGNCLNDAFNFASAGTCDTFENVSSQLWDFGDGASSNLESPYHQYADTGAYVVEMVAISSEGCKDSATLNVSVLPIPQAKFTFDTVCLGAPTVFNSDSSKAALPSQTITGWQWNFGDGSTSALADPSHTYATSGSHTVSLVVTSTNTCTDSLTDNNVFVRDKPIAGFFVDPANMFAYQPVPFTDQSMNSVKWLYNFGDGDTSSLPSPTHTYNIVGIYTVKQVVYNALNCADSITVTVDLNAHLTVPNAFSPNGDNTNDKFDLLHKGIVSLTEFKIFNRWGEVVFEGPGDLSSFWDGTFRGVEQPVGVYVYYIVGKTVYGDEITLKGNLTLLR
ncbi:MAG: PKD domain-containing protein [Cytophagaceae bacterium]|nr:PKD domain-containing protein [Cytophagaceae bacterium]